MRRFNTEEKNTMRHRDYPYFSLFLAMSVFVGHAAGQDLEEIKKINGAGLFCRMIGKGDPLVVVHGGPGLGHDYLVPHFRALSDRFRLIFYDQRGCGRSDAFTDVKEASVDLAVEDLDGIRKEFGLQTMNLAGQSWGAVIAIEYALKYPEKVQNLLLLEPAPASAAYLPEFQQTILERLSTADREEMTRLAQSTELNRRDPDAFRKFLGIRFKAYFADRAFQQKMSLQYFDRDRVEKFFTSSSAYASFLQKFDLYGKMDGIKKPTLIIRGQIDPIPPAAIERMHRAIRNSELHVIPKCGHFVHIEKPDAYFSLITAFLRR
jgi:proline iminopeptidase